MLPSQKQDNQYLYTRRKSYNQSVCDQTNWIVSSQLLLFEAHLLVSNSNINEQDECSRLFSTYLTLPLLRRMFSSDFCNSYPPPGLKLLVTSVAPKIQTSSERSYRKCWNFPRVKAIISRWSFLSLQSNTYCSRIQVAFLDTKGFVCLTIFNFPVEKFTLRVVYMMLGWLLSMELNIRRVILHRDGKPVLH